MRDENQLLQQIWSELSRAVSDRSHAWRTPVLASVDDQGLPQARTIIMRQVDPQARRLFFYTDHRSPKVKQFQSQSRGLLVFWSRVLSWQLRVQASISVETDGRLVQGAWESIRQAGAAADYLSFHAPGSPLGAMGGERAAEHSLGIIVADVKAIDWLELNRKGHRRAMLVGDELQWLVP